MRRFECTNQADLFTDSQPAVPENPYASVAPLEHTGRGVGALNPWDQPPTRAEIDAARADMSPAERAEQLEINRRGLADARAAINEALARQGS